MEIEYFMSSLASDVMGILTENFLWMRTLGSTPILESEVRFPNLIFPPLLYCWKSVGACNSCHVLCYMLCIRRHFDKPLLQYTKIALLPVMHNRKASSSGN